MMRYILIGLTCGMAGGIVCAQSQVRDAGAELSVPEHPVSCPSPPQWVIRGKVELEPGCIYTSTLSITESHTSLDCRGSIIDPGPFKGYALKIDSLGAKTHDVTIRNCIIRNSNAIGIVIGWSGSDQEKVVKYSREEIYRRTPHQVHIINTRVEHANGAGIYIDDYVSDVTLRKVSVSHSASMAVYLEHSSQKITIEDSLFENNSVNKQREALAIDSSAHNVIRRNVFRRNKAGSIFLYKNCQEHAAFDSRQTKRWQGADENLIEDNLFEDEVVGIWIGSRQSRDLRKMRCGEPYYGDKFVIDKANNNVVMNNIFKRLVKGVLVEDDDNIIRDNHFHQIQEVCIRVGSVPRAKFFNRPVKNTYLINNTCFLNEAVRFDKDFYPKGIEFIGGSRQENAK